MLEFNGLHYLLTVDYYSKWIEIAKLDNLTSTSIICHLKSQFARHGIPDEVVSDNGPQYASAAFTEFTKSCGFVLTTTSPHYPQANGEFEGAVEIIENLLRKAPDPYKTLLNYRNTPLEGLTLFPAQLLIGRRLKTSLPVNAALLKPQGSREVSHKLREKKEKEKFYYDRHSSNELRPLVNGDKVSMQRGDKWIPATVVHKYHTPRPHVVQTPEGQKYRRNRRHLHIRRAHLKTPSASARVTNTATAAINPRQILSEVATVKKPALKTDSNDQCRVQETVVQTRSGRIVKKPTY